LIAEGHFKRGFMHDGKKINYFSNENIQAEKVYKEGKRNGRWVFNFENGNI